MHSGQIVGQKSYGLTAKSSETHLKGISQGNEILQSGQIDKTVYSYHLLEERYFSACSSFSCSFFRNSLVINGVTSL